eukprot:TRINITY_DN2015_c0_g2_i1.p1 TRINITY_DN2015_c0_g2~~TRINITY_DN2015_c0_g2_i1.p1  ORF type:complete len:346 (+),score=71.87 TRINITY_DN2015_c0_g2_i1:748-1785(+)
MKNQKDVSVGSPDVAKLYAEARKRREAILEEAKQKTARDVRGGAKRGSKKRRQASTVKKSEQIVRSPKRKRVTARRGRTESSDEAEDRAQEEQELEQPPVNEEEWVSEPETEDDLMEPWEEDSNDEGGISDDEDVVWKEFCESIHNDQGEQRKAEEVQAEQGSKGSKGSRGGAVSQTKKPAKDGTAVKPGGNKQGKESKKTSVDTPKPVLQVSVWNWFPMVQQPESESKEKDAIDVRVCGQFTAPESDDEDSGRLWRSNPVVERKSARLLSASDGKVVGPVKLLGKLDIESMLKEGFSETVAESFNGGFPEDWHELLEEEFSWIAIEKTKEKAGRGKREKKPSKK